MRPSGCRSTPSPPCIASSAAHARYRGTNCRPGAIRFRHPHVLHRDLAVLDHLERDLVLDLFDAEAGRGLVLDDEALHLVVAQVARPDDRNIAPRRVADPSLLAIENPDIAFTFGGRG